MPSVQLLAFFLALSATASFWVILARLGAEIGQPHPIGDEKDYLARSEMTDPHQPDLYVRMPLVPALASALHRTVGSTEQHLRLLNAIMIAVALFFLVWVSVYQNSPTAGVIAAVFFLLQPEVLILARHLWPECILSALVSALTVVLMVVHPGPMQACLLGLIIALAFTTRFEQIALVPAVLLAWFHAESHPTPISVLLLCLPSIVIWITLTVRNFTKYGIPWPDTTWQFNLDIAQKEYDNSNSGESVQVNSIVQQVVESTRKQTNQDTKIRHTALIHWRGWVQVLKRFWALLGPDRFVSQRLFPPCGRAYPRPLPAGLARWLRWAFPSLVSFSLMQGLFFRDPPAWMWPILTLAFISSVAHTRTRYRVPMVAPLALWVAPFAAELLSVSQRMEVIHCLLLSTVLAGLLVLTGGRSEDINPKGT